MGLSPLCDPKKGLVSRAQENRAAIVRSLELTLVPDSLRMFFPLLQQGVDIEVEVGVSVKALLIEQLGLSTDYIASRISTLFLNSKAVDDTAQAFIHDDSVLALSGAMPGLVGATMRSGGYYAAMRGAMTYRSDEQDVSSSCHKGRIRIKLFNLLLEELGPRFLSHGILLSWQRLRELTVSQSKDFCPRRCRLDGKPVTADYLLEMGKMENSGELVALKIDFGERES